MSILIKGMEMPKRGHTTTITIVGSGQAYVEYFDCRPHVEETIEYTAVPVPAHGRLIDADALRTAMYHEAFETGTPMQKWDSGCWIRYKMFERVEESAPTIIPASEEGET